VLLTEPASKATRKFIIYGAGSSGVQELEQLKAKSSMQVIGFIDD